MHLTITVKVLTHGCQVTTAEGIACVSIETRTGRGMVDYSTQGIDATGSGTRVFAFLSDASLVAGTIRVNGTLDTAIRW